MKTKRLISMILTCVMLVAAFTGITVFAAEETDAPSVEIVSKNIYFGETINLMYAVKAENADGCELELTVLAPDGKTYGVEKMEQVIERDGVECPTFKAKKGEAAQNINKVYTATATLTKDGEVVAKDVVTYSVLEYIFERKPMTTDPNEIAMLDALKAYAAAADKVINAAAPNGINDYVYVTVAGATEALTGIYKAGDKLSLVPDVEITADMTAYWIVNGEEKSLEEMADYTIAGETTISLYTSLHVCADENGDFKCDDADETGCTKIVPPAADSTLTIAQAIQLGQLYETDTYSDAKYYVEGLATEFYGDKGTIYGNMYITDGTNTFLVYGIYKDGVRYDALDVKPVPGDTIKVYGVIGQYKGTSQVKNAELIELTAHECVEVETPAVDATCLLPGLTAGTHCEICNKVIVAQEEVGALGHTTDNGTCERCGTEITPDSPSEPQYTQVTKAEDFTTGSYIIVATNGKELGNYNGSWVKPVTGTPEVVNGVIVSGGTPWTLTVTDGKVTLKDENGEFIKPKSGNNNGIQTGEYACAFEFDADGNVVFKGVGSDTSTLAWNAQNSGFRFYKNSTASGYVHAFAVYKLG